MNNESIPLKDAAPVSGQKPLVQADVLGEAVGATPNPGRGQRADAAKTASNTSPAGVAAAQPSGDADPATVADIPPAEDENQPGVIGQRNRPHS